MPPHSHTPGLFSKVYHYVRTSDSINRDCFFVSLFPLPGHSSESRFIGHKRKGLALES